MGFPLKNPLLAWGYAKDSDLIEREKYVNFRDHGVCLRCARKYQLFWHVATSS
jgi:hypothetical protein